MLKRGPVKKPDRALQKLVRVYAPSTESRFIYVYIHMYIGRAQYKYLDAIVLI